MMRRRVEMSYDSEQERWIISLENRKYGLRCGEYFHILAGKEKLPCRLELDSEWYIILSDVRFNLRVQDTYLVSI